MASFTDLIATFDPDAGKRGRQFEHFIKWFLKNDPEWATQVDEVWLWNDYPGQWGRDCGIDLIFKHKNEGTWAVQAKCYSPNYEITKSDVDKFLSESNRTEINHRLLIATTDRIGANARQVIDAQEKSVVRYHLTNFENAAVDYPDSIERLSVGKRKPLPQPRPHQIEAIDNVTSGFQTTDRGQLIMACGTGKTFVCLWVKERLKAKRTLVLVPSLNLLSQILNDWTFAAREQFDALCVCSDQTVNRREEDKAISFISDLAFPVSNDVVEIAHFLKHDNDRVIFSTYQSSPLIAEAQKTHRVPRFDLVIADEAHRCAGKSDTVFGTVLDDGQIQSERRLFATATPRVYKTGLKIAAEEFGVEVVDMNDETSFGKRFHTLTFGEAIKRDLLTDYRVLIVGVDNERIKEWIEHRRLIATDTGLETDARSLAGQIGLLKAIKDWNLRRLISFHGRVKRAKEFSEDIIQVAAWLDEEHRPSSNLRAEHVSGEMPTIARRRKLKRLKNVGKGEIGLLSNARCLSEGVDVPALDGVAFIDPRSSEIDIIQSVGRAIRLSENKTMGTIVIPVFIEQTENAEAALEASDFKPIWDVLEALKSHDNRLSDELDQLRIELGANRKRSVGASDLTKLVFDLPTSVNEEFAQSLRAYLVAQTTESWMFCYGLLEMFVKEHGHCRVPQLYKTDDGYGLGKWVSVQRGNRDKMSPERRERLDEIGFVWDPLETAWEEGYRHLTIYVKRTGHCRAPQKKMESGFPLGQWVSNLRAKKDKLAPERRQMLDELGFIWDSPESDWEEGYSRLRLFKERVGHCRVPARYRDSDGYRLGQWVNSQRARQDSSTESHRRKLNDIGFVWNPFDEDWEIGFSHLKRFKELNGHCRVPQNYKTENGFALGQWVSVQRLSKANLPEDRVRRLDELGFIWDSRQSDWDEGYARLNLYKQRNGHCLVPVSYKDGDGFRLGGWVFEQRQNRKNLSEDRLQKLGTLGLDWNPLETAWMEGFHHLQSFKKREGHCRVPVAHIEGGYALGKWVNRQRTATERMSAERRRNLDEIGFVWRVR
jgi:superfamily II DNA or RNA helicase